MARLIDIALLVVCCTFAIYLGLADAQERQVEVFVNVYNHPKTGFSCKDKAPGAYYADPESKCAVYYICIPNPIGTLSPQSFACPNGTIFSQATRVCRPHEEVYCPLAARYYGSNHGNIDQIEEFDALPIQPIAPAQPPVPRRQSPPRTAAAPRQKPQAQPAAPLAAAPPQPPAPQAVPKPVPASNSNLFNGNNGRFRNSRIFASTPVTSTTTTPAPRPPPAAGPAGVGDYEYDYADYNETDRGTANAASSLHATIIENVAEAIAKDIKSEAQLEGAKASRRKRDTNSWMLSRRKGQLVEAVSEAGAIAPTDITLTAEPSPASVSFTCEDKVAGLPYADVNSGCNKFYLCVNMSKGKLWSYHLDCDEGKRFNQALGMCDSSLTEKECARSERYYAFNKWHKQSKKHFLDSAKKLAGHQ